MSNKFLTEFIQDAHQKPRKIKIGFGVTKLAQQSSIFLSARYGAKNSGAKKTEIQSTKKQRMHEIRDELIQERNQKETKTGKELRIRITAQIINQEEGKRNRPAKP